MTLKEKIGIILMLPILCLMLLIAIGLFLIIIKETLILCFFLAMAAFIVGAFLFCSERQ